MPETEREIDIATLRLATVIGSRDAIAGYRKARVKKGDIRAVSVIDDVLLIRKIELVPKNSAS